MALYCTTKDVDLLVEPSELNLQKVLAGLAKMQDGWAREITPKDLLENVVVKSPMKWKWT